VAERHMQIGEVAERTGLSLRTIRYYEEVGLVRPSSRSRGGFRLYSEADVDRLRLVKQMKPLEFTLEQMSEVLSALDRLGSPESAARLPAAERARLRERLRVYHDAAESRRRVLLEQLHGVERFAAELRTMIGPGRLLS